MATTVNFTSLVQDISNTLERGGSLLTDPTVYNQIPRWINAAERKIMQFLKLQGVIEVLVDAPSGLQIADPIVTKPDRWRATVSMSYGAGATGNTRTPLYPRGYEYCRAYWPDSTVTAPPEFYADYDLQHWIVVPTPDQNYPLEILAYMQPVLLDAENQSNFFSNYTPNLLLYAALMESAPFLKDDPRIATWEGLMNKELASLNGQDLARIMDRSSQRKLP